MRSLQYQLESFQVLKKYENKITSCLIIPDGGGMLDDMSGIVRSSIFLLLFLDRRTLTGLSAASIIFCLSSSVVCLRKHASNLLTNSSLVPK